MIIFLLAETVFVIINLLVFAAGTVIGTFLPATLPSSFTTSLSTIAPLWSQANNFFPVSDVLFVIQLMIATKVALYTLKLILWVISKLPFIGGGK